MRYIASVAAALLPLAYAQTFSDCNPMERSDCPAKSGLNEASHDSNFQADGATEFAAHWTAAEGTTLSYGENGAQFVIAQEGQAPTVEFNDYIFFGRLDVTMQAAHGAGIVSSIVLESDTLDEIDWEFIGSDTAHVQSNFFGKGNTTSYDRAVYHPFANPQASFHTYSIDWTPERIEFSIDGAAIRTIPYDSEGTVGGFNYPQTPMRVKLGNWCGGCTGNAEGTISWAEGPADFSQAPFTMYVRDVTIANYRPAEAYEFTDNTGSAASVALVGASNASPEVDDEDDTTTSAAPSSAAPSPTATLSTVSSIVSNATVDAISRTVIPSSTIVASSTYTTTTATNGTLTRSPSPTRTSTSSTNEPTAQISTGGASSSVASVTAVLFGFAAFLML